MVPVRSQVSSFVALLGAWARRDFKVRYSQTLLGGLWAIGQPVGVSLGLVFLLQRVGASASPGVPYGSFVFSGMLCWTLFSNGVTQAMASVTQSMPIVAKIRFPRIVAPLSGSLLPLVDFTLSAPLLPLVLVLQHSGQTPRPVSLIVAVTGTLVLSTGVGCFAGAVAVFLRDLRNALPFVLQVSLLATPVAYPADRLPAVLRWNPMATFISEFRSGVVDTPGPATLELLRALVVSAVVLGLGIAYFRSVEERFADVA